uniref:Uncharacterized protein n=1 Tax=Moniliophthora roreri TaxID=221103 RepID=A0A0W0EZ00_MONRR
MSEIYVGGGQREKEQNSSAKKGEGLIDPNRSEWGHS